MFQANQGEAEGWQCLKRSRSQIVTLKKIRGTNGSEGYAEALIDLDDTCLVRTLGWIDLTECKLEFA